jgi:hypothetical protein
VSGTPLRDGSGDAIGHRERSPPRSGQHHTKPTDARSRCEAGVSRLSEAGERCPLLNTDTLRALRSDPGKRTGHHTLVPCRGRFVHATLGWELDLSLRDRTTFGRDWTGKLVLLLTPDSLGRETAVVVRRLNFDRTTVHTDQVGEDISAVQAPPTSPDNARSSRPVRGGSDPMAVIDVGPVTPVTRSPADRPALRTPSPSRRSRLSTPHRRVVRVRSTRR